MIWLDNARIAAILAVVILHSAVSGVVDTDLGSGYWWAGNLYSAFSRWCVPVFVMISGALLLSPARQESLGTFYRKRMSRVLWPFLFWSAFFLGWTLVKGIAKGKPPTPGLLVLRFASGEPYYHLWFLYMLIPLYLFVPFLRKVVAHATRRELVVLTTMGFVLAALALIHSRLHAQSASFFPVWFLSYLPYFLLGHLIASDTRPVSPALAWSGFIGCSLLTAAGCYALASRAGLANGLYCYDYLSVTVIPMSASVMYLLKTWQRPLAGPGATGRIAGLTMGVYLIHPLFLEILQRVGLGPLDFHPAAAIPLAGLAVFGLSLTAAYLLDRLPVLRRTL